MSAWQSSVRTLVVTCPDWAVIATGRPPSALVAVVQANRVVAAAPAARAAGVRTGMRRREAQAACPSLEVIARDLSAEARLWEPAVAAVEAFAPGVEVVGPGELALGSRGPSRYFGGDAALAAKVAGVIEAAAPEAPAGDDRWAGFCHVGVADGLFTAGLAARLAPAGAPIVVAPGNGGEYLGPLPITLLSTGGLPGSNGLPGACGADFSELVDLLGRLGIKTFGAFVALPAASVLGRFGAAGQLAHELASGCGGAATVGRRPPPDWAVAAELDPPAEDLQAAVFVGRALAERLYDRLAGEGLACSRLAIEARVSPDLIVRRSWRYDGALSAAAIAERARWQLEGWQLNWRQGSGQPGLVTWLCLVPEEIYPATGRQLGMWGQDAGAAERAGRALARVQSMLGPQSVGTAVLQGGRDHAEQVLFVPWGEPRLPLRPTSGIGGDEAAAVRHGTANEKGKRKRKPKDGPPPWPGRIPGTAPTLVHRPPRPAQVLDQEGCSVTVGSRGEMSALPAWVLIGGSACKGGVASGATPREPIGAWAGPWPLEERWWDAGGRRRAWLQVCTARGQAYLLAREKGSWWVEATYD